MKDENIMENVEIIKKETIGIINNKNKYTTSEFLKASEIYLNLINVKLRHDEKTINSDLMQLVKESVYNQRKINGELFNIKKEIKEIKESL